MFLADSAVISAIPLYAVQSARAGNRTETIRIQNRQKQKSYRYKPALSFSSSTATQRFEQAGANHHPIQSNQGEATMNKQTANVIVHVAGKIDTKSNSEIRRLVDAQPGVGRTIVNPRAERLILVDYDPFATSAQQILTAVRDQGVSAQLVGM
jgi:hypothetical protein